MKNFVFFIAVALLIQSCTSSIEVTSDYDKKANFTSYQTFNFLPRDDQNQLIINEFDWKRLTEAIITEMEARGYKQGATDADMVVGIHIVLEEKTDVTAYSDYYGGYGYGGWGYGYGGMGMGMGMGTSTTSYSETNYIQGTLIVDVINATEKKLLWQGIGIGTIDKKAENKTERVNNAIGKIFEQYPIPKQSPK